MATSQLGSHCKSGLEGDIKGMNYEERERRTERDEMGGDDKKRREKGGGGGRVEVFIPPVDSFCSGVVMKQQFQV